MAAPTLLSATASADGKLVNLVFDQVCYLGPDPMQRVAVLADPNYITLIPRYLSGAGSDTWVFNFTADLSTTPQTRDAFHPDMSWAVNTTFTANDIVNGLGEVPTNVSGYAVADTASAPTYYYLGIYNYGADVGTRRKIMTPNPDKLLVIWNSGSSVVGEEALVDAYIDEWGIASNKYAVDFDIAANNGSDWWNQWGGDLYDQIVANGIEQVACSPSCPTNIPLNAGATQQLAGVSRIAGNIKYLKKVFDQVNDVTEINNIDDYAPSYSTGQSSTYFDGAEGVQNVSQYPAAGIRVNGIHYSSYLGTSGDADDIAIRALSSSFAVAPNGEAMLRLPSWRIGYYPISTSTAPTLTTTIIRTMVQNSKASINTLSWHSQNSEIAINAHGDSQFDEGRVVQLGAILDEIGYQNTSFGYHTNGTVANLANIAGRTVGDTGLTKYEADDVTNSHVSWVWTTGETGTSDTANRYIAPGNASITDLNTGIGFHTRNAMSSFPITPFILFDSIRNFADDNDGAYLTPGDADNVFALQAGGIRINETSHGHRMSIHALASGASCAYGSFPEPGQPGANRGAQFLVNLLRGCTAGMSSMLVESDYLADAELWGDGLAQPFKYQSTLPDGGKTMIITFTGIADDVRFDAATGKPAGYTEVFGGFWGLTNPDAAQNYIFGSWGTDVPMDDNGVFLLPGIENISGATPPNLLSDYRASVFFANVLNAGSALGDLGFVTGTGFTVLVVGDFEGEEFPWTSIRVGTGATTIATANTYLKADFGVGRINPTLYAGKTYTAWQLSDNSTSSLMSGAARDLTAGSFDWNPNTTGVTSSLTISIESPINPNAAIGGAASVTRSTERVIERT